MKINIILTLILFIGINSMMAQNISNKVTPEQRAEKLTVMMKKNLSLTDEQYTQVLKVNTDFFVELYAAYANSKLEGRDKEKAIAPIRKQLRVDRKTELKTILTKEQLEKLRSK